MTKTSERKYRLPKWLVDDFSKAVEREHHLRAMKDEVAKQWIIELQENVIKLQERLDEK